MSHINPFANVNYITEYSNLVRTLAESKEDENLETETVVCIFCGTKLHESQAWAHIDGDANLGVKKIEYFCSQEHKYEFFNS
ncbi:MAG: hypothetical protein AB7U98_09840 [Candidatus Nitrosocosmicus sp.]|uniref:hypothetical protein n=1 Tax=Candidatus Nitrosocosmicus sp. FF01 TaxID=3397670 RepID=UPI002A734B46|nr:hypothetical protein [Candidatus Nitrosocosmicus sp.]